MKKKTSSDSVDLKLSDLHKAIDAFSKHMYDTTQIFIGHPDTLMAIDYSKIPNNCWFLADYHIEKGQVMLVKDTAGGQNAFDLKKSLYDFLEKHPERFFRGEKM